ncbi:MAG: hypothetical protein ACXVPU_03845 [Bacteroidia bacterium]
MVLILISFDSFAQDFTYSNISIVSATFSGGNLNIRKDDGTGSYTAPQWLASSTTQSPVAYVSGNAPTVAGAFTITCANVPDSIFVRGSASDAINFPATKVVVAPSGTSTHNFSYPATPGSHIFTSSIVRFFKPFTINWEVSFDNGITWKAIGATSNTLYVTRSAPQAEGTDYKWYHTVFDLSCRNAQYQTLDTAIISHVWNEFLDHIVLNYNDDSLFYYKTMNSPNVTLGNLLKYRDAECYTFAQLFLSSIKIQGVVRTNDYVYITPINNLVCGHAVNRFIVKNWNFGTPSASATCATFPYKNVYNTATGLLPPPYTAYVFTTADVTDQVGIPGVCNVRPSSYFNNHQIVKLDGVYYDACYGATFPSLGAIKTAAFSGWSYRYTVGANTEAYFTNDLSQSDLSETITTF